MPAWSRSRSSPAPAGSATQRGDGSPCSKSHCPGRRIRPHPLRGYARRPRRTIEDPMRALTTLGCVVALAASAVAGPSLPDSTSTTEPASTTTSTLPETTTSSTTPDGTSTTTATVASTTTTVAAGPEATTTTSPVVTTTTVPALPGCVPEN